MEIEVLTRGCQAFMMKDSSVNLSGTIQKLVEDMGDDQVIPLPNVDGPTMALVLEYCDIYTLYKHSGLQEAVREFLTPLHISSIFAMLNAANYLDIQTLLQTLASHIAGLMQNKTPQELRDLFLITNDFTPAEEAQILEENAWAIAKK